MLIKETHAEDSIVAIYAQSIRRDSGKAILKLHELAKELKRSSHLPLDKRIARLDEIRRKVDEI